MNKLFAMVLALCACIQSQAGLKVSQSLGDDGESIALARQIAKQSIGRQNISGGPKGEIYAFVSLNTTNTSWPQQRENALQGTKLGGVPVGQPPANFTPLAPGQLGEPWMTTLTENGGGYQIRFAFHYWSPTKFKASTVKFKIGSSDSENKMNFTGTFPGLSVSRIGTDWTDGKVYSNGDPLINEVVIAGVANAFIANSKDATMLEEIRRFIADHKPWSISCAYTVDGFAPISKALSFNVQEPTPLPPTANFDIGTISAGHVQFIDLSRDSTGGTANLVGTHWTFGDGTTHTFGDFAEILSPTHEYKSSGTYTVTLVVTDKNRLTHSKTKTVTVTVPTPTPTPTVKLGAGSTYLSKSGEIPNGTPLKIWAIVGNSGTIAYTGTISYWIQYSINNNVWINWTLPSTALVGAGAITNLFAGEARTVEYTWATGQGTGQASEIKKLRFLFNSSAGQFTSSESEQFWVLPAPVIEPTPVAILGTTSARLSKSGDVTTGSSLTVSAPITNSGNAPSGKVSYSWLVSVNGALGVNWESQNGVLVGAGTLDSVVPGQSVTVSYTWPAGVADMNNRRVQLKFTSNGKEYVSGLSEEFRVTPPPGTFVLTVGTPKLSKSGEIVTGSQMTVSAPITNSGNGSYTGTVAYSWLVSVNGGSWENWELNGKLVGAGTLTNLLAGEIKTVSYPWTVGSADASKTTHIALKFTASDGVHTSALSEGFTIVPVPQPVPALLTISEAGNFVVVSLTGPSGTYEIRRSQIVTRPWTEWSHVTVHNHTEGMGNNGYIFEKSGPQGFLRAQKVTR